VARTVDELLLPAARDFADRPALTAGAASLSYAEVLEGVRSTAAGLARLGLRRGERVAVFLDKRVETVLAFLGTSRAGGVFVPVNPVLKPHQVAYILRDCAVRVLVTTPERWVGIAGELRDCPSVTTLVLVGGTDQEPVPDAPEQVVGWEALTCGADAPSPGPAPVDTDVAAIFYTSGSTGMPKGVVLSHRNIVVGAESVSEYLHNTEDDVILAALPFSFDAGFSQLTTAFSRGAHLVLVNYLFPADVVRLCARYRVTGLTCVPPLWIQLASAAWPAEARASLRYFANTGGRLPKTTMGRLRELFPSADPYLMYGLTEAFRSTYLDPSQVDARPDSIGKAIPNAEIIVARPDGTVCDDDEPGELVHRGPLVSLGYWNDPERTAARFRPAPGAPAELPLTELAVWSGDSVVRDSEGFLYFVGRQDEMIKTSGYRVSPTEVEEAAYDTGLVRDVVAIGVPDEALGQRIVVVAVRARSDVTDADVVAGLRQRLPLFMVPREVVLLEDLPRSPNGKFDRVAIRAEVSA